MYRNATCNIMKSNAKRRKGCKKEAVFIVNIMGKEPEKSL